VNEQPIRLLIADDHPVFRFGLRALVESQPDMVVVSEAQDGEESVRLAQPLRPDVVLMDVNMLGLNGIEATRRITASVSGTAILIITMFDDDTVFTAMQAGARGYLLKGAQGSETLRAIRAVANGDVIFSPGVAEKMMAFFARGMKPAPDAPFPDLTPRERDILEQVAQGQTNSAIAE
jgi:DNA-binding NarL/FixJ family response regulator